MPMYTRDGYTFTINQLKQMGIENPSEFGFSTVQDIVPNYDYKTHKAVRTDEVVDNKFVYNIVPLTEEEIKTILRKESERILREVDSYLDIAIIDVKRYDSRDAIGKYLVEDNIFYTECKAISLWISDCYQVLYNIQNEVMEGTRGNIPTLLEVFESLPKLSILTEEEQTKFDTLFNKYFRYNTIDRHIDRHYESVFDPNYDHHMMDGYTGDQTASYTEEDYYGNE